MCPMAKDFKKPIAKFRAGAMSISIWENSGSKDGKKFSFKTASLQRSYKVDNVWKNENLSLRASDIPKAILVLNKAFEDMVTSQKEDEED